LFWPLSLAAQAITDFESFSNGAQVMFRQPSFSGTTGGKLDPAPNFSYVTNSFPAGNPNSGGNVYMTDFSFLASNPTPLWVRLTTSGTANLPNTIVSITDTLEFDIYSSRPIYVALGIRETDPSGPVGGNGGTSGTIEWVGGTTDNTQSPPLGRSVSPNTWTTLHFDIPTEPVRSFTGDGVLTSTTGKDVLEHLALVANDGTGEYQIFLDNFRVVAVPEPATVSVSLLTVLGLLLRRVVLRHRAR
jgi:hypothetical protein